MKTRTATILSLLGVMVAGSAAALVNTQVLNTNTDASVGAAAPITTMAPPATSVVPVATQAEAPSSNAVTYSVGDSGTVTLDRSGDSLVIADAVPAEGWTLVSADVTGPQQVRVIFRSASTEVAFTAASVGSDLVTDVTARDLAPSSSAGNSDDGDGDHDEADDEDHHDGDHEDDDDHDGEHRDDHEEDDDD